MDKSGTDNMYDMNKQIKSNRWVLTMSIVGLLAVTIMIVFIFTKFIDKFASSTETESASHLQEINNQLRLYVEESIESD